MSGCKSMADHKWTLGLEEGRVYLAAKSCSPDDDACLFYEQGIGDLEEVVFMPPVPVDVRMATDCPAYPTDDNGVPTGPAEPMRGYDAGSHYIAHGTRCDCNWWPVVIPRICTREEPGA